MFDYGLDEADAVIPAAHHQAAFEAGSTSAHGVITGASTLSELLAAHSFSTETRKVDGALIITGYNSTEEWGGTRTLFEALAPYIQSQRSPEAYLVWGCSEFVERWHFADGQMLDTCTNFGDES